jgi:uncharacterized membrane protein
VTTLIHRGTNARYSDTATRNIESILKLEKEDQEALSPYHRLSHAIGWFVGTVYFVLFECAMVIGWIAFNVGLAPTHWTFDPYPFPLLAVVLGLEAVLLTSFVLIRQNAIDRTSERRNHLDLQINLLAEEEATKVLMESLDRRPGIREQPGSRTKFPDDQRMSALALPGSTGRRNTGVESLCWGFKLQVLTGSFVELTSHFVQIGLRVHRQVGALWKARSQ